jgi:chaperone modulatory protein CbpM
MITIDVVIAEVSGLRREELEGWIANAWVRPDRQAGQYAFADIDVARVRLILQLRDELEVNEAALPVVLGLLDQLYDLRRQFRAFNDALEQVVPSEIRLKLTQHLTGRADPMS